MKESIEKHAELNPKLFIENDLIPEVRQKLLRIVEEFIDGIEQDKIPILVNDVLLIGSNASYNYTEDSDIDLHLVVNLEPLDASKRDLYLQIYQAYKVIWNNKHDISINGIPVEIFIETPTSARVTNGCYSVLTATWITAPTAAAIPEINMDIFNKEFAKWEQRYKQVMKEESIEPEESLTESSLKKRDSKDTTNKVLIATLAKMLQAEWGIIQEYTEALDNLVEYKEYDTISRLLQNIIEEETQHVGELQRVLETFDSTASLKLDAGKDIAEERLANSIRESLKESVHTPKLDKISQLIEDIYRLRAKGLSTAGEYSLENLIFKEFRNRGYLEALKAKKLALINKELSLNPELAEALLGGKFRVPSLQTEILEELWDSDVSSRKILFSDKNTPICEVEVWSEQAPVVLVADFTSNQVLNPTYPTFKDFSAELLSKYNKDTLPELFEDTIKIKDHKWVNKGDTGKTHGEFTTKKEADAQRKAIFASGWHK